MKLGLRENAGAFALLVVVNAFVGAMVGLERSVLPILAADEFGLVVGAAILSFIAVFGLTKALANYVAGRWSDRFGRKPVLVAGWLLALPVPALLMWAPTWGWVLLANALLGVSQGLTWSTTVIMKIDLVGPRQRGLAMGLNEFAGYLAVAVSALATGWIAAEVGPRSAFALGLGIVALGLLLSVFAVGETREFAALEAGLHVPPEISQGQVFRLGTYAHPTLSAVSQAGLVNNLNDGMAWGLFPLLFVASGMSFAQIGLLAAIYPAVWGIGQLFTGALSDHIGRKGLIVGGMWLQAVGLGIVGLGDAFGAFAVGSAVLGLGTAMVYPTLLAAIGDVAHPSWRASAVGVYRLWRDLGYVAGALVAGAVAGAFGVPAAIAVVAALTFASGGLVAVRMVGGPVWDNGVALEA